MRVCYWKKIGGESAETRFINLAVSFRPVFKHWLNTTCFYCYSTFDLEVSAFGRQCGECSLCITAGGGGAGWRWWAVFLCTGCESCVRDVLTKHGQTSSRAAKGGMWEGDELAPKQFIKRTLTPLCLHSWATPTRAPTSLFSLFFLKPVLYV